MFVKSLTKEAEKGIIKQNKTDGESNKHENIRWIKQ